MGDNLCHRGLRPRRSGKIGRIQWCRQHGSRVGVDQAHTPSSDYKQCSTLGSDGHLRPNVGIVLDIEPRARYGFAAIGNYNLYGDKYIEIPNEPEALIVNYHLRADAAGSARVTVSDATGRAVRQMEGPAKRGLNRAVVSLGGGGRGGAAPGLSPGEYVVTVDVGGEKLTKPARVRERIR